MERNRRIRTTAQVAIIMAVLTLGSKLIGFVREMLMAAFYGTTYVSDTYNISIYIPNMIFLGVLSATANSFIPLFSKKMENEGEKFANLFTSQTINILLLFSIISSLVGMIFSGQIVTLFTMPETLAPSGASLAEQAGWFITHGWTGEKADLAAYYLSVTFSFCLFNTVGGIAESWLRYKNIFISPIVAGYVMSVSSMAFIMISHRLTNPYLLIFGSLVGVAIRTVTICIIMGRRGYRYRPNFHMTDTVRQIFVLALPVFLGSTAGQINLFVNKTLASGLATGSVAALSYAELLTGLITGVTATIISTVLYPRLAQAFAQSDEERFRDIFTSGVNLLVIIGAPFTLGILVYSRPVVQIIYERGVFNSASTEMTAAAFFFYGIGLVFSMIQLFLVQAFYSRHNTRTPLVVGAFIVAINIIANLVLVKYLAHGGLALGWSIATFCNTILLLVAFRKKNPAMLSKALVIKNIRTCFAAAVSVGFSYFCHRLLSVLFSIEGWILPRTLQLGVCVLIAAAAYVILLRLLKTEELIHFRRIFRLPSENTKE